MPISDYGIDAQVEIWEEEKFTGKLIALQIKSGASYFKKKKGDDYVFTGEFKHLDYWTRHPLPVFLILHNPVTGLALWQKIEKRLAIVTDAAWSIVVPAENILNVQNKHYLSEGIASDPEAIRRFNLAFDLPMMRRLKDRDVYLEVNEWVNKSLNIRDVGVFFDEAEKDKPDFMIRIWVPARNVSDFMQRHFPWLDCEYLEVIDGLDGEVEVHSLRVWVNELGKQYIAVEDYCVNGPPEREELELLGDGEIE